MKNVKFTELWNNHYDIYWEESDKKYLLCPSLNEIIEIYTAADYKELTVKELLRNKEVFKMVMNHICKEEFLTKFMNCEAIKTEIERDLFIHYMLVF